LDEHKTTPLRRAGAADVAAAALLAAGALAERRPAARRAWLAAVPIVIVNYVAFRAQLRYWEVFLDRGDALLVSAALESIAVYLAWQAHLAQLADDSALRLRLAAYAVALIIGALNYSHYMLPGWRPTPAAVVFGGMSAISPWLWSAHSRRESRDSLKARGLIEDHAVRLGATRWFWHAYRCTRITWAATWAGVTRPAGAIALIRFGKQARDPDRQAPSPAPGRKPRPRAVRAPELAAARAEQERELIAGLAAMPVLPGRNELARDERLAGYGAVATRRRAAGRLLAQARTTGNGYGAG
jgi:hypothetical protein